MTNPPGRAGGLDAFFARLRASGYYRDTSEKWLGGVCSGLARRWGIDPILLRVGLVVLAMFSGFGLLPYLIALALLPDETGRIWAESALRGGDGRGIALIVLVAIVLMGDVSDLPWPFVVIAAVAIGWWILRGRRRGLTVHQLAQEAKGNVSRVFTRSAPQPAPAPPQPSTATPTWGDAPAQPATQPTMPTPTPTPTPTMPGPWGPTGPQDAGGAGSWTGPGASAGAAPGFAPGFTPPVPGSHGLGPGRTDVRRPPDKAWRPPRRRSAGFVGFLIIGGLSFLAAGAAVSIGRQRGLAYSDLAVGGAAAVLTASVCLVLVGLRGRRAPFLTFLTLSTAAIVAVAAVLPPSFQPVGGLTTLGTQVWVPENSTGSASASFRLGGGEATLDLSLLTSTLDGLPISAAVSMGELTVVVPAGLTVKVEATAGLGAVSAVVLKPGDVLPGNAKGKNPDTTTFGSGAQVARTVLVGSGDPDVVVTAKVGLGEILVVRPDGTPITDLTATGARS